MPLRFAVVHVAVAAALALSCSLVAGPSARAQDKPLTEAEGWRSSLAASLAGSQSAFSNWQEGGINALSATSALEGAFSRLNGKVRQDHEMRFAFGILKQDTLDVRKAEDQIRLASAVLYNAAGPFEPTFSADLRTQFAAGFDYNPDAAKYPTQTLVPGDPLKVSDFFAPAFLTQSLGVTWDPKPYARARLGLGLKETVVGIRRLRPVYGNRLDQAVRVEAGIDALLRFQKEVFENVSFRSRISSFYAFQGFDEAPDVLWENGLVMTVNKLLNVTIEGALLYDADVSDDVQLKQVLQVGIAYQLIGGE